MDLKKIFNNNKAVSPVIGVVLMVAITVILAAAIGSSVFGQGPSESAPQANINIIVVNESAIKLEHLGGDTVVFDDNSTTKIMFSNETENFELSLYDFNDDYFDVGDTEVLRVNTSAGVVKSMPNGDFATVKIVDVKTKQLIADKELRF
jgi:flagellin-like protein